MELAASRRGCATHSPPGGFSAALRAAKPQAIRRTDQHVVVSHQQAASTRRRSGSVNSHVMDKRRQSAPTEKRWMTGWPPKLSSANRQAAGPTRSRCSRRWGVGHSARHATHIESFVYRDWTGCLSRAGPWCRPTQHVGGNGQKTKRSERLCPHLRRPIPRGRKRERAPSLRMRA